jgi:hypothetical protein
MEACYGDCYVDSLEGRGSSMSEMLQIPAWAASLEEQRIARAIVALGQFGWKEIQPFYLEKWCTWKVFQSPRGVPYGVVNAEELFDLVLFAIVREASDYE